MKLDRLLAIALELMTRKRVRAADLAARFEVSKRTIYREIEKINLAGIPVVSFAGADGGFELMDGFFLSRQHFTVDDFRTVYQLLQSLEGAVGDKFTDVKHKLVSLHPRLMDEHIPADLMIDLSTADEERGMVRDLWHAVKHRQIITFRYQDSYGTTTERKAEPMKLFWERGAWYLAGHCLSKQASRLFRVSRMSLLQVLQQTFQPRLEQPTTDHEPAGIPVKLRFARTAAPRVLEHFREKIHEEEGYYELETLFYSMDYAVSVVLSYGTDVTVISPNELAAAVVNTAQEIQKKYSG